MIRTNRHFVLAFKTPRYFEMTSTGKQRHSSLILRFVFLIVAIGLLTTHVAFSGQVSFQLAAITVSGSTRYPSAQIVPVTGLKLGQPVSLDALKEAANKLAMLGVFTRVNYRYQTMGNSLTATFIVQDSPKLLPCSFDNFVWFSPQELQKQLRARVPLFEGEVPVAGDMSELVKKQLRNILKARGIDAQVEFSPFGPLNGPVQGLTFKEVGVPLPIRKIEFTGVRQISPELLQAAASPLMDTSYDGSFIRVFSRGTLDKVYLQRGYLQASFGPPKPQLLSGGGTSNAVAVTIPVQEGEQYSLGGLQWQGQSVVPYQELRKMIHAKIGQPVDALALEQDLLKMLPSFIVRGYLMAKVDYKPQLDDATHSAICDIVIDQGNIFYMGNLQIHGVSPNLAESLEKRVLLRAGDPYNPVYWAQFVQDVAHRSLLRMAQTIHPDTRTVDVQLFLSSR